MDKDRISQTMALLELAHDYLEKSVDRLMNAQDDPTGLTAKDIHAFVIDIAITKENIERLKTVLEEELAEKPKKTRFWRK